MSGELRFKIDGKVYDTASVDEISLRDVLMFNKQAADMGLPATWADVERIAAETAALAEQAKADGKKPEDMAPHPDALLMFAVTVWASRRIAGDDVTLEQAVDVPMSSIEIVEGPKAPKDHQRSKKKSKLQQSSARAVALVADEPSTTTPPTSSDESASA